MRVYPDTNVLFPVRLVNLIMRSHAAGLIDVVWSDELLDEFRRVLVEKKGVRPELAQAIADRFSRWSPSGRIDPTLYRGARGQFTGRDADDHVHAAAARACADVLLTDNISDFPPEDLSRCRVATPAALFGELGAVFPAEFARLLNDSSNDLRRPHRSPADLLEDLRDIGLEEFALQVQPYLA